MSSVSPADIQDLMDDHDIRQIEDLAFEYGRLMDWFNETYPTSTIKLEVNSDQRDGTLNYELSVMSGKDMSDDQMFVKNKIVIDRKKFMDISFMDSLKKSIYPQYRKTIERAMNEWYAKSKKN